MLAPWQAPNGWIPFDTSRSPLALPVWSSSTTRLSIPAKIQHFSGIWLRFTPGE